MEQVLEPLSSDRARIDRITARLHETDDTTERADLGAELVRALARYEDAVERALVPHLHHVTSDRELGDHERRRKALRDAMTVVHERTMHVDPRNVHASDPTGFEAALDDVLRGVEGHLRDEDRVLDKLLAALPASEREELARAVAAAAKHASERPHPPKTPIGRAVSNANVKLDHSVEDVSTPQHPGAEVVDGPEGGAPS